MSRHTITEYHVQYTDPNRSEGGSTVVRSENTQEAAFKLADRLRADPELSGVSITKQVSVITRERIT